MIDRREGNQAAYERLVSDELCYDLAHKFARRHRGESRMNYGIIAKELVCLRSVANGKIPRSLVALLREKYKTDSSLRPLLMMWDKHIYEYILASIDRKDYRLKTHGLVLDAGLMRPLAKEYVRDRANLMRFLSAAFRRWRRIYAPDSLFRVRVVTQQIAPRYGYNRKRILEHLQKIGAIPENLTKENHVWSQLLKIGQYLSRDQRAAAAGKNFGFRRRPKRNLFLVKKRRPPEGNKR